MLVAVWLKSFWMVTMEMSTIKSPMLSMTHAIFWGLQNDIKDILCSLSSLVTPRIKLGLTDAHCKLSNYYYQYDTSPFYTWAACMWGSLQPFTFKLTTTSAWSIYILWRLKDQLHWQPDSFLSPQRFKGKFVHLLWQQLHHPAQPDTVIATLHTCPNLGWLTLEVIHSLVSLEKVLYQWIGRVFQTSSRRLCFL